MPSRPAAELTIIVSGAELALLRKLDFPHHMTQRAVEPGRGMLRVVAG